MTSADPQPQYQQLGEQLDSLRSEIRDKICQYKLQRRSKLRSKLLLADPTRKKFWRFLKGHSYLRPMHNAITCNLQILRAL